MLISFVIPLYNCGPFIARCLDSILAQGLTADQYEVIVVNDGSKDDGPGIVKNYQGKHPNILLLNQENRGPGMTRNRGVDNAKGDYVVFIDADDAFQAGAIPYLLTKAKQENPACNPDLIIYNYQNVYEGSEPHLIDLDKSPAPYVGTLSGYVNSYGLYPTSCNQIYTRDFIKRHRFSDSPYAEDLQFMYKIYASENPPVVAFNLPIYHYYMRDGSMIHNYNKEYLRKIIDVYCGIMDYMNHHPLNKAYDAKKVDEFTVVHVQSVPVVKLLSGNFSLREIKSTIKRFKECGILPFKYIPNRYVKLMDFLCRYPLAMYIFSFGFVKVYLRWLKK